MNCPSCGIANPVGASFCTSCGTRLIVSTEPVPSSGSVPPSPKDATTLAHHFAQAATVLGPERLVRYSGLAGEQALATYALEEALAHFERGLTARGVALGGTAPARDAGEAALLFGLARAKSATLLTDQLVDAFDTLRRAFDYYAEAGEVALAVETAEFPIGIPTARFRGGDGQVIARALALVRADSHEAGRLLSRYGGYLGLAESDYEGAQPALVQAISIARRENDVPLEVQTLAYAANVSGQHLHWQESVDIAVRAIKLSTGKENTFTQVLTRFWAAVSLLHMGDPDAARPHVSALRDMAEMRGSARYLINLSFVPIITLSCLEGDWRSGREHSDRSLKVSPQHPQLLALRVLLEYETGHSIPGQVYLERLLEERESSRRAVNYSSGRLSMVIAEVDRITGSRDHWEIAKSEAGAILSAQSVIPVATMFAKAGLALLAVQQGDQPAAKEHYDYFVSHRGTMMWTLASADRLLGLLAKTMGDLEQAAAHFEDALAFCRKAGYRPELAWSLCDYSDTLVARGQPGDRTSARDILEECLAITNELGMRPLMERVAARLAGLAAGPPPAPAYPDGLTQREVEVLRLIAQGRSNPAIAQELVVSVRTVTTHVSNIFSKINAANRAEAATYAIRNGLI